MEVASSKADFAIPGYSIKNATDGKPRTYWGVRGRSGQRRIATFVFKKPVGGPNGTVLTLTIRNNFNLGRFRLLATSFENPLEIEGSGTAPAAAPGQVVQVNPNAAGGAPVKKGPYRLYVNCGDISVTDPRGNKWEKAKAYKAGSWGWTGRPGVLKDDKEKDPLLKSCTHNMDGYHFDVPNGKYKVTLYFSEHWAGRAGERVFSASIEGKLVAEGIDLAQNPGRLKVKTVFKIVEVKDGKLEIEFSSVVKEPLINAIKIEASR